MAKKKPSAPERTRKPKRPAGRNAELMRAYILDMLAWVEENKTACIPKEFCDLAGIGRTTLKRYEDLADLVNDYGWKTSRARMRRGRSNRKQKAQERIDGRILGEHARWGKENAMLRERMAELELESAKLREDVKAAGGYSAQLENYTDVLLHELAIRDRTVGRELATLLASVRDRSMPTEFLEAIREANRGLLGEPSEDV